MLLREILQKLRYVKNIINANNNYNPSNPSVCDKVSSSAYAFPQAFSDFREK